MQIIMITYPSRSARIFSFKSSGSQITDRRRNEKKKNLGENTGELFSIQWFMERINKTNTPYTAIALQWRPSHCLSRTVTCKTPMIEIYGEIHKNNNNNSFMNNLWLTL